MEFLLVVGGIWFLIWIAGRVFRKANPGSHIRPSPQSRPGRPPPREGVYRPTARGSQRIVFTEPGKAGGAGGSPPPASLEGLHDAFTGAPLNPALGLHQCINCKVYYHAESFEVLRAENASRCVACGSPSVVALTAAQAATSAGRDYNPDVVTLANYRQHFDRVVTFEGLVQVVKPSKRGSDYAVMFENASWTRGLKLVFFKGAVGKVGGPQFIKSLQGRHVRVRGLLIRHHKFGPEIVISESNMILEVR